MSPATVLVSEKAAATDSVNWVSAASVAAAPFCAALVAAGKRDSFDDKR